MKIMMLCSLMVSAVFMQGMDEGVDWAEIGREYNKQPETKEFKIPENQIQQFEEQLGDFMDKSQVEQEEQSNQWKMIDLRKTAFIAAKAKEISLMFKNGSFLADDLCSWIADRLNYLRYEELLKNEYFNIVKSDVENAIAAILIKKKDEKKLNINSEKIKKACKDEAFLGHIFAILREENIYRTIGNMSEEGYLAVFRSIIFNDSDEDEDDSKEDDEDDFDRMNTLAVGSNKDGSEEDEGKNDIDEKKDENQTSDDLEENEEDDEESNDDLEEGVNGNNNGEEKEDDDKDDDEIPKQNVNNPQVKPQQATWWNSLTGWFTKQKNWIFGILGIGGVSVVTWYLLKNKVHQHREK